jgi:hypothetical protein
MMNGTTGQTSTRKKSDSLTDVEKKSPISGKKDNPNLGTIKIGEKIETMTTSKVDSKASNTNKENNSKGSKETKSVMTTISVKKK